MQRKAGSVVCMRVVSKKKHVRYFVRTGISSSVSYTGGWTMIYQSIRKTEFNKVSRVNTLWDPAIFYSLWFFSRKSINIGSWSNGGEARHAEELQAARSPNITGQEKSCRNLNSVGMVVTGFRPIVSFEDRVSAQNQFICFLFPLPSYL
jgi:hypothetical protein